MTRGILRGAPFLFCPELYFFCFRIALALTRAGASFCICSFPEEGVTLESNDLGDLLLMMLDDDLFPREEEPDESEK